MQQASQLQQDQEFGGGAHPFLAPAPPSLPSLLLQHHHQQQQHPFAERTAAAQQHQPQRPQAADLHRLKVCGVPPGAFTDARLRQLFELCGRVSFPVLADAQLRLPGIINADRLGPPSTFLQQRKQQH